MLCASLNVVRSPVSRSTRGTCAKISSSDSLDELEPSLLALILFTGLEEGRAVEVRFPELLS